MADKTLKSLNFGGVDNYFPLPLVTAADNDKILSVVNGEWAVINFPGNSGEYVWSKQFAGGTATEDTTGGTYTLTTDNDTRPSSEIEMSEKAPIYNSETKKWEFPEDGYPTVFNIVNTDNIVPGFPIYHADSGGHGAVCVRVTSEPNIWYTMEYSPFGYGDDSFNVGSASANNTYTKNFSYSRKYTADVDSSYEEYVAGGTADKYPDGGWSDGAYCKLILSAPSVNLISFTIDVTSYQAEDGMTWEQFSNSEYNSGNEVVAWVGTDHVTHGTSSRGALIGLSGGGLVTPNDIIIDNGVYTTNGHPIYPPIGPVEPT